MEAAVTPLIVITGPTASGKTAVALRLAEQYGGEIVCADSRTVYKGLDIGTAKPTLEEQTRVPHHLIDRAAPDQVYNLAQFQQDAYAAIADIRARGKVPLLVGGSGLYIDSVVLRYELKSEPDPVRRAALEAMPLDDLLRYCIQNNIKVPENSGNKRYVIRAIEQGGVNSGRLPEPEPSTFVVGISTDSAVLKARILARAETMFDSGLIDEVQEVAKAYGWDVAPLRSPAYAAARRFINNEISKQDAIAQLAHDDWQLARKQMTWLRRNQWVHWHGLQDVESAVHSILARFDTSNQAKLRD